MRVLTWNVSSSQQSGTLTGHRAAIRSLAFASDGHTLASGDEDGVIEIWDTSEERSTKRLAAGTAPINALAFHPRNADRLFVGSDNGQVTAWSVARGATN
jgi:WD40 repeat protein